MNLAKIAKYKISVGIAFLAVLVSGGVVYGILWIRGQNLQASWETREKQNDRTITELNTHLQTLGRIFAHKYNEAFRLINQYDSTELARHFQSEATAWLLIDAAEYGRFNLDWVPRTKFVSDHVLREAVSYVLMVDASTSKTVDLVRVRRIVSALGNDAKTRRICVDAINCRIRVKGLAGEPTPNDKYEYGDRMLDLVAYCCDFLDRNDYAGYLAFRKRFVPHLSPPLSYEQEFVLTTEAFFLALRGKTSEAQNLFRSWTAKGLITSPDLLQIARSGLANPGQYLEQMSNLDAKIRNSTLHE